MASHMKDKDSQRLNALKGGADSRKKREESQVALRKKKKDQELQRRRFRTHFADGHGASSGHMDGAAGDVPTADDPIEDVPAQILKIPEHAMKLRSQDPDKLFEAASFFRRLLSVEDNPPINECVGAGVIAPLVHLLGNHLHPAVQFDAAWALTNIASGTSEHTRLVVEGGAVPPFVQLLESESGPVREQAVWALGNIAGDCPRYRDTVLRLGALSRVLRLLNTDLSDASTLSNATWTLSNFCRGAPSAEHLHLISPALPVLAQIIKTCEVDAMVTDACWALSYVSNGDPDHVQAVVQLDVCPKLVQLSMVGEESPFQKARVPALRTLGNIIAGNDDQTQTALDAGALQALLSLLNSRKRLIRKEVCWALSNVTAGTPQQIELVLRAGGFPLLMERLAIDDAAVQTEACWAISNAIMGGVDLQVKQLCELHVIKALRDVLHKPNEDMVKVALEGLQKILSVGQRIAETHDVANAYLEEVTALEIDTELQELADHDLPEISQLAMAIIETYFEYDESEYEDEDEETEGTQTQADPPGSDGMHYGAYPAAGAPGHPHPLHQQQQQQPPNLQQAQAMPAFPGAQVFGGAAPAANLQPGQAGGMFTFGVQGPGASFNFGPKQ